MGLTDGRTGKRPPSNGGKGGCGAVGLVLVVVLGAPVVLLGGFAVGLLAH